MSTSVQYQRPGVTVDVVAFSIVEGALSVFCPPREESPYQGKRCLPGGFLLDQERLSDALLRVIKQKTALNHFYFEQLETFDDPHRDPRGRVLSVAYLVVLNDLGDSEAQHWRSVSAPIRLGFDHTDMVAQGLQRLRAKMAYTDIGLYFLAPTFTLSQAQSAFESVLGQPLEKRNFRKQLTERGLVEDTGEMDQGGAHRPAKLYRMAHRQLFYWN